jgi:hypothetical protein
MVFKRRYVKISIVVFLCLFNVESLKAQDLNHNLFWFRLVLADKINDKISWDLYLQNRTQNSISQDNNWFANNHMKSLWFWLYFKLSDQLKLSVSPLGLFQSSIYISKPEDERAKPVNEYRFALRLDQEIKYKYFNYSNRIGVESRWRDLQNDKNYIQNFRFRYVARVDVPVKLKLAKQKIFTLSAYNEVFLQSGVNTNGIANIFDQNRTYFGIGRNVAPNIKLNVGYILMLQQKLNGKEIDQANTLWVILTFDNLFVRLRERINCRNK